MLEGGRNKQDVMSAEKKKEEIRLRKEHRAKLAIENPRLVNNLMMKYNKDPQLSSNAEFLTYPVDEDKINEETLNTIVTPLSFDNIHFSYSIRLPSYAKPLEVDSFYGTMYELPEATIALPVIPYEIYEDDENTSESSENAITNASNQAAASSESGAVAMQKDQKANLHFQVSQRGCWLIAGKVAKLLTRVPPKLLVKAMESGRKNNLAEKFGFNKKLGATVLDFKVINDEMPSIVAEILSFSQSSKYRNNFLRLMDINEKELEKLEFVKNANKYNPDKKDKITSLEKLLTKHLDKEKHNNRPLHHVEKVYAREFHNKY